LPLTRDTFEQTVSGDGIVLDSGPVGGPCRQFAPVFERASNQHKDIVFGKVDTEAEQELARSTGISSIPTLMAFRDGILVFSQPGALPSSALEQLIAAVRGLDMDEARKHLAERAGKR
jgi:thioredoxin 1